MNELLRRLLNLPIQASSYAADVDALHYFVIGATLAGSAVVFAVALYFTVRYRRRPGDGATPRVAGGVFLEFGFIGGTLGLFLLIWVVGFAQYRLIEEPPAGTLDVYVVAKQWMWKFTYPQGPASAGVLYVPVHRAVKLIMTSRDVIHSFYVPAFRMKQDAVPGRYTLAWFEANQVGTFPIRCAEYCGTRHAEMLGDVVVLSEGDFEKWLAGPDSPVAEAMPGGEKAGEHGAAPTFSAPQRQALVSHGETAAAGLGCFRCHTIDGTPHIAPTWSGLFGKQEQLSDGTTVHVDEAYLTESMMDPAAKIVAGFQPVMPSYQGKMEPAQVAAIVEFIKTLTPAGARARQPNPLPVQP